MYVLVYILICVGEGVGFLAASGSGMRRSHVGAREFGVNKGISRATVAGREQSIDATDWIR